MRQLAKFQCTKGSCVCCKESELCITTTTKTTKINLTNGQVSNRKFTQLSKDSRTVAFEDI